MGDQNDTRVSLFKTITEEIEGFNAFFNEMLTMSVDSGYLDSKDCIDLFEDLTNTIHKSVLEETESGGMEVEEIKRLDEVLNDLWNLVDDSDMDSDTQETIVYKIYELQETIVRSSFHGKVKEMKQRIEQARSAAKKEATKKLGDDKVGWWWW